MSSPTEFAGKKPYTARARNDLSLMIWCEQFLCVFKQLRRLFADNFIFENFRIAARQFPRIEKRRPINERRDLFERKIIERFHARRIQAWQSRSQPNQSAFCSRALRQSAMPFFCSRFAK